MRILRILWQMPQSFIALLVYIFLKLKREKVYTQVLHNQVYIIMSDEKFGVSLGEFIFVNKLASNLTMKHESGHSKQSRIIGPLYLLLIGLPSITGNIYDRVAHKKWSAADRIKWYYSLPWEAQADKLGGVKREYN
jgi:hypothetical protein